MTLEIAVIIPCYNQASTLKRAAQSAIEAGAAEVVIINDASTDDTDIVAYNLARNHHQVWHTGTHSEVPGGVCHARNLGISKCQQPLIVPLDADDYLMPQGLDALRDEYSEHHFVYSDWWDSIGPGKHVKAPPIGMVTRKNIAHATWLFARDDWLRAGGYNPLFNICGEDWAFMLALLGAGVRGRYAPYATYAYSSGERNAGCKQVKELTRNLITSIYGAVHA